MFLIGPELIQARYYNIDSKDRGGIGDAFSGTLSPIIAWIAAILTFSAFYVQYIANEQQKKYLKQQRFEDTFFRLLENHQRMVESMDIRSKEDPTQIRAVGRDCFKRMYRFLKSKNTEQNGNNIEIDFVKKSYNTVQEYYKSDLHHYFRFLYHILKFIRSSDLEEDEKYKYSSILRAALSPYELVFIFYNCLHEYGIDQFKPLVEQFSFLKNLDDGLLLDITHKMQFHEIAFASFQKRSQLLSNWRK